jgi:hypothetical protein
VWLLVATYSEIINRVRQVVAHQRASQVVLRTWIRNSPLRLPANYQGPWLSVVRVHKQRVRPGRNLKTPIERRDYHAFANRKSGSEVITRMPKVLIKVGSTRSHATKSNRASVGESAFG